MAFLCFCLHRLTQHTYELATVHWFISLGNQSGSLLIILVLSLEAQNFSEWYGDLWLVYLELCNYAIYRLIQFVQFLYVFFIAWPSSTGLAHFVALNSVMGHQHVFFLFKVFSGNSDQNTAVKNAFDPPIVARYIRIHPKSYHTHVSMRAEFRGCSGGKHP